LGKAFERATREQGTTMAGKESEAVLVSILSALRANSRRSAASIARELGLATSTVFCKIRSLNEEYVERHVSLLDNHALGLPFRTMVYGTHEEPEAFLASLQEHASVNNVQQLRGDGVAFEMLFSSLASEQEALEALEERGLRIDEACHVIETVCQEQWVPERLGQ
jgi:DNA-binding Lrp family transcriptional regulator